MFLCTIIVYVKHVTEGNAGVLIQIYQMEYYRNLEKQCPKSCYYRL